MSKPQQYGFGFIPTESQHHFKVHLAEARSPVRISEHFSFSTDENVSAEQYSEHPEGQVKIVLSREKWKAICDDVRASFNIRLKKYGLKSARWKKDTVYVGRLLGKELVLLCWAIEDADPSTIPTALLNWGGLEQEERWWLYSMANAATGHYEKGRNRGWRKAIRFALTENPALSDQRTQEQFRLFSD